MSSEREEVQHREIARLNERIAELERQLADAFNACQEWANKCNEIETLLSEQLSKARELLRRSKNVIAGAVETNRELGRVERYNYAQRVNMEIAESGLLGLRVPTLKLKSGLTEGEKKA